MKPLLAANYVESKLVFPLIAQPKIDGVRGLNIDGRLVGRSLKQHANRYVTQRFSDSVYSGLDGELASGFISDSALCRNTTGDLNRIWGSPDVVWYVFDDIRPEMLDKPYFQRLAALKMRAGNLPGVQIIESRIVNNLEELYAYDAELLDRGMEGTILRSMNGLYKQGRSTPKSGELLRIKRFIEEEAEVMDFEEGENNNNEAKTNELGRTARSTHKENMSPNGQVGTLICRTLKTNEMIRVGAGCMSHEDRRAFFRQNGNGLIGQVIKYKFFPKGVKDKPRFPTFQSFRMPSDMS